MKKSTELRREHTDMLNQMQSFMNEGKVDEAHELIAQLKDIENAIQVQEEIERNDEMIIEQNEVTNMVANKQDVFRKLIKNEALNEAEVEFMNATLVEKTDTKGGFLVPIEQVPEILEFRRQLVALKDFCTVVPVGSNTGTMPAEVTDNQKLIAFTEDTEINASDLSFKQIKFSTADYGDLIAVSNTLLDDEKANLMAYIGRRFGRKAVRTENDKIITVLKTLSESKGTKGIEDITTAVNSIDPALWNTSIIITNQSGYDWLDQQVDKNGRPMLQPMVGDETKLTFKGRRVVVLSDGELPNVRSNEAPFFIGDLGLFAGFYDRQILEVASSEHAGFNKNVTVLRAIERFDVQKWDDGAMKFVSINVKTVPAKA